MFKPEWDCTDEMNEIWGIPVPEDIREKTKPHTDRVLCIEHFSEWWNAQKEVRT